MSFVFPNHTGTIEEFAAWYKANNYPVQPPFEDCVYVTDISYSYVLFRQGRFQAEVYLVKPNANSEEHSHPGVENIILFWGGDAATVHDGVRTECPNRLSQKADGTGTAFGVMGPKITDANTHALQTGDKGAAFLSLEKWPEDVKPTSVVVNWKGAPICKEHAKIMQPLGV